jgi:hypothetical protein
MNVTLMTQQELDTAAANMEIRLGQSECLVGLAVCDELHEAADRYGNLLPLYRLVAFASKAKGNVGRVHSECHQIVSDVDDLSVQLLEVQIAGS